MVMDSLRYWVTPCHVDGFRFDLASTLGREANGFDPGAGFFDALRQDPTLAGVKLIAEPWDVGPGGYQLGSHPPGFAEWNDRFRDARAHASGGATPGSARRVRRAARGLGGPVRQQRPAPLGLASTSSPRMTASRWRDVVSYASKHNEANGEDNRDGHADNLTSNWGVEGPTDDPAIDAVRGSVKRAMLATLLLRRRHADAAGRRRVRPHPARQQQRLLPGQRHVVARLDAGGVPTESALTDYVARLIALRGEHPVLRHARFLHGRLHPAPGIADIEWFDQTAERFRSTAGTIREQRTLMLAPRDAQVAEGKVTILSLLLNPADRRCRVPAADAASGWRLRCSTAPRRTRRMQHRVGRRHLQVARAQSLSCSAPSRARR